MKIEQLEQLLRVVEEGSMNEAAKKLFIARTSLSTSMKNLEDELGEPIFSRHSKGVCLTPFGVAVYNQANLICGRVHFLQELSNNKGNSSLNVASMYCCAANDAFATLIERRGRDKLSATIEESPLSCVIRNVADGRCEIGVITIYSSSQEITEKELENSSLEFHEMVERPVVAIVGPNNPMFYENREFVEQKELGNYPNLENYGTPQGLSWENPEHPDGGYRADYRVSDLGLALRIISTTDAVMVDVQDKEIYADLYGRENFRYIPVRDHPPCRTGWIKPKYITLSPLAEEYLQILEDEVRHRYCTM